MSAKGSGTELRPTLGGMMPRAHALQQLVDRDIRSSFEELERLLMPDRKVAVRVASSPLHVRQQPGHQFLDILLLHFVVEHIP